MLKTFKNNPFQNQKPYDLETKHAKLRTQALQSINDYHVLNLTYLTPWSNLIVFAFKLGGGGGG